VVVVRSSLIKVIVAAHGTTAVKHPRRATRTMVLKSPLQFCKHPRGAQ
jgi:hypothetical protein